MGCGLVSKTLACVRTPPPSPAPGTVTHSNPAAEHTDTEQVRLIGEWRANERLRLKEGG